MPEQILLKYIKQNLAAGFPEEQIRQALRAAGWQETEIEQAIFEVEMLAPEEALTGNLPKAGGFFGKYGKPLITVLVILIALPILGYGGLLTYQKFFQKKNDLPPAATQTLKPPANATQNQTPAQEQPEGIRDRQRIVAVQNLQTALESYYETNKFYPQSLTTLVDQELLVALPRDPKTNEPYLYTPLGEPALHYSLSFLLETNLGTLKQGLQVVSSENRLPADLIISQDSLIKGLSSRPAGGVLLVTDLSKKPFYPTEEVTLEVRPVAGIELVSVKLVMPNLDLLDRSAPFQFRFSAPKEPGEYEIKIFGFETKGAGFSETAKLSVTR